MNHADRNVSNPEPFGDVALYIDWENIKYSLWNHESRVPNALALKDAAARFGRVVAARAYANWQEAQHQSDPSDLYSAGIEPVYVPTRIYAANDPIKTAVRRKNSVDVKLTVDAVDFCLTNPNIHTFVLVTGDGDFVHLVNALRSRGKQVILIGCSWSTSWQLTSTADQFIAYDVDVDPLVTLEAPSPGQSTPELEKAFEALDQVMHDIRREGEPNVFAQVKLMLVSRLGRFDERQLGFASFKAFMREAETRGIVKTYTVGLIDRAYLPDEHVPEGIAASEEGLELRSANGHQPPAEHVDPQEDRVLMGRLLVFLDDLERNSPFMSFNFMAERAIESGVLPPSLSYYQVSSMLNVAIEEEMLRRETKEVFTRATNEYRDVNIFKLNRSHPFVAELIQKGEIPAT